MEAKNFRLGPLRSDHGRHLDPMVLHGGGGGDTCVMQAWGKAMIEQGKQVIVKGL